MRDLGVLAIRGLAGGALVAVFALIGEVVSPKVFSGLFSAAPSVAFASRLILICRETGTSVPSIYRIRTQTN